MKGKKGKCHDELIDHNGQRAGDLRLEYIDKNELPRRKQRGIDSRKEQSFAPQAAGNLTRKD
jgi:hypothetical protein